MSFSGSNACSYFFVVTNQRTRNSYSSYITQVSNAEQYQIIRHHGANADYNFYATNLVNKAPSISNTTTPVNSSINEAYIIIFQFKTSGSNTVIDVYKHENGSNSYTLNDYDNDGTALYNTNNTFLNGNYSLDYIRIYDYVDNSIRYNSDGTTEYRDDTINTNLQGEHRLARGRNFFKSSIAKSKEVNQFFKWGMVEVPTKKGHGNTEQMVPYAAEMFYARLK